MRPSAKRYWLRMIGWLVLLYLVACGLAWLAADGIMFPARFASGTAPPGAFRLRLADGSTVSALHLPNPEARFTLWYFHGNGEDLGDIAPRLAEYQRRGFAVFAVDYPGYGTSEGRPSERSVIAAAEAGQRHLAEQGVSANRILLYGRSIGGGPAVEMARRERFAGLVIESGFVSAYRVMTRWPIFPGDRFRNLAKMPEIASPVFVIHGRRDEIIPFWHGEKLHAAVRGDRRALWMESARHNDVIEQAGETYWRELHAFAESLP